MKDRFETEYQGSLARLENAVEEEYIAVMKQSCYRERSYRKQWLLRKIYKGLFVKFSFLVID